jgi:hypothetical protein
MNLFYCLVYMASVSTDPNVSLRQEFTTFNFEYSDSGKRICDEYRKGFNQALVKIHDAAGGRFECHVMTAAQIDAPRRSLLSP